MSDVAVRPRDAAKAAPVWVDTPERISCRLGHYDGQGTPLEVLSWVPLSDGRVACRVAFPARVRTVSDTPARRRPAARTAEERRARVVAIMTAVAAGVAVGIWAAVRVVDVVARVASTVEHMLLGAAVVVACVGAALLLAAGGAVMCKCCGGTGYH